MITSAPPTPHTVMLEIDGRMCEVQMSKQAYAKWIKTRDAAPAMRFKTMAEKIAELYGDPDGKFLEQVNAGAMK
jgi:hypothetical protein